MDWEFSHSTFPTFFSVLCTFFCLWRVLHAFVLWLISIAISPPLSIRFYDCRRRLYSKEIITIDDLKHLISLNGKEKFNHNDNDKYIFAQSMNLKHLTLLLRKDEMSKNLELIIQLIDLNSIMFQPNQIKPFFTLILIYYRFLILITQFSMKNENILHLSRYDTMILVIAFNSLSRQTTRVNTIIDYYQIENVNQKPEALDMTKFDKMFIQWDYILSTSRSFVAVSCFIFSRPKWMFSETRLLWWKFEFFQISFDTESAKNR